MQTQRVLSLFLFVALLCSFLPTPLFAQPESAHSLLYFAQFADGGPFGARWETSFTLANPNNYAVDGIIALFDDDGQDLSMDFGSGATTVLSFSLSAFESQVMVSEASSQQTITGWAYLGASSSVQGVATYRYVENGSPAFEISVPGMLPAVEYFYPATEDLGIALANIYTASTVTIRVTARSNDGRFWSTLVLLPPNGHTAKSLKELLPGIGTGFTGTVKLQANQPGRYFAALALKSDGALYSSLPAGGSARPVAQFERIWDIFNRVLEASKLFNMPSPESIDLVISADADVNAYGGFTGIQINLALAELIADSESELAWVIGHELGHVYQARTEEFRFNFFNRERDADVWGLLLSLSAGYDPYAGAGALAKMAMATGTAGLTTQLFEGLFSPLTAHGSFNDRLDAIYDTIQQTCNLPEVAAICATYHDIFHPHLPGSLLTIGEAP